MFDRVTLQRDLVDARGTILGRRGLVISVSTVIETARRGSAAERRAPAGAVLARDLRAAIEEPACRHLFRGERVQSAVARALDSVRLPGSVQDELAALAMEDAPRYRHAVTTAAVATRILVAAVGDAPGLPEIAAAGLLHDVGMRHVARDLTLDGDPLAHEEVMAVASHPLVGGLHLAVLLGDHPAVYAALGHHWRGGHGYPWLPRPPSRSVEVVAVASAFAALTHARPFRSAPYDARGAVDLLVAEAKAGRADGTTVRLLVHALRGAGGEARAVRFGRERQGHAPDVNHHTHIAPIYSVV
jgi:HD-GYP domain-containing protein (c-di-GMP phosphodiesterase class II)